MKIHCSFTALFAAAAITLSCSAQAPASAPAGSTGICKDGTYSNAANKDGACRGHKGVQSWYAASVAAPAKAAAQPANVPAPTPAAPTPAARPAAVPEPTATPAPSARQTSTASAGNGVQTSSNTRRTPLSQEAAAAGGGPGQVWVNTASKVYHCPGTAYYGKTKAGKYLSEDAAKAEGDRANGGKLCAR
ncbi:MAG: DUF3761 domain-containing protein [Janthinobacterium lividum]